MMNPNTEICYKFNDFYQQFLISYFLTNYLHKWKYQNYYLNFKLKRNIDNLLYLLNKKLDDTRAEPTNSSLVFIRQICIKNVYVAFFSIAK